MRVANVKSAPLVSSTGIRAARQVVSLSAVPQLGPAVVLPLLGKSWRLCHNGTQQSCGVRKTSACSRGKAGGAPMADVRVIATDLEFPEGPVAMPDGSVLLVEIRGQRLTRIHPDGRKEVVAKIPGGPNGAAIGPDGKCYICNNGGFSWIPTRNMLMPGPPAPHEYIGGSIQRVDLQSGKVETVGDRCADHPLKGPNDLVVA